MSHLNANILVYFHGPDEIDNLEEWFIAAPQMGDHITHQGGLYLVTKRVFHTDRLRITLHVEFVRRLVP